MSDPQKKLEIDDKFAISEIYSIYARAIDEKRYDLLERVFTPDATLQYIVGPHEFTCSGGESAGYFGDFLRWCYWTNHMIAAPMIEADHGIVKATARVIATHIQKPMQGPDNRWILRGSYHDKFTSDGQYWRISDRYCVCTDSQGEFIPSGMQEFPAVAWADPARI